jgi:beta-lactamase class A
VIKKNRPVFTNYYFNVDHAQYYYPASTVKLPTALLALEKINKMRKSGVHSNTSMITESATTYQSPVYNDPTTGDGRPTIDHYIRKIFLVSDNDAFNRLYEFLGQEQINQQLHRKGYSQTDILHRLSIFLPEEENRKTNPVLFVDDSTRLLFSQPMKYNSSAYPVRADLLGSGYYSNGQLINGPMNFSSKNRLPLEELHSMMRTLMFPSSVRKRKRFKLTDDQYRFVWQYLSQYPSEGNTLRYDSTKYWDAYGKFLYWGGEKGNLPKSFRSFSKEGDAYGFLIDAAYIVDFDKNIEFLLSAVIYCNKDGILNDNHYDYNTIGLPFLKNLGRVIYQHELKRQRTRDPDLSTFRIDYNK